MSVPTIFRIAVVVLACLLPAPSAAHARGVASAGRPGGVFAVGDEVRCAAHDQEPQQTRSVPKVIGWLYRWVRGFDIERSTTPSPQLYLRSPLLAGFNEPVNCPPPPVIEPRVPTCVAVTASDGQKHVATYLVPLPQEGARTTADLAAILRQRLEEGEPVLLRTLAGNTVELDPVTALEIDVRTCESEIG